ncbi:hypothetical protein Lal_00000738 [Lupinus albus]|nr:hypothetical protein Lal_00000738 [Lupinus albus]
MVLLLSLVSIFSGSPSQLVSRMDLLNPTNMDVTSIQHVSQGSSHHVNVESTSNPTPEPSQSHVGEDDNTESTMQPAPKKHRSVVKQLGGSLRNGTKHLHNHMELCVQKKIMTRGNDKGQTFLLPKALQGKQELGVGTYDAENTKRELANAIIMHDYPLSIVDHIGFRRYSAALQPLFQVPSRNTIKKEIFKVYDFERECAMKMLDSHEGRVAITSDMWTSSNQKRGYMAVTAHYIDCSWTLQSRVLRFIYVPAPHTSDILSNALVECFMDWNIDTKISTITLDNCSSNDAMIPKIKDKLRLGNLLRDGSLLHMRCCAHILNLIVKDGLEVVKDGIEKIRDSVAYWNATPKRNEKFEETAKQLRVPYTKKLILDCPTRWNSTYKMLETNGIMYPTLQAIAKDLLAIPISTVASESAFSTSGRILSPHRSRLNWTTLEALMCARSWLWSAENARNLNSSLREEYATVLNEMESDDEVEVMNNNLSYNFED